MTEARQISWCRRTAALLIVLGYFALAAVAPSCLWAASTSNPAAHHQHHGQGKVAHSLLCAWACQAGSSPALLDVGGIALALFLLLYAVTVVRVPFTQSGWAFARPRSPPFLFG